MLRSALAWCGLTISLGAAPPTDILQARDSLMAAAERALLGGESWRATRMLTPLLDRPETRTPEVLLLAARSAAGWEGWTTVTRLLTGQAWLDRNQDALGRALLARAAVERGDPGALIHALRAVDAAPAAGDRGRRLVTLARALDRAGQFDSAARLYLAAGQSLPAVRDWLDLRAAGVTADSTARAALYARVTIPAAQARIRWTEALALERSGNHLAAARAYEGLGAALAGFRLRLAAATTDSARGTVRNSLVAWLGARPPAGEVAAAVGLLDRTFPTLGRSEELTVSRRAAAAGLSDRAARGFARAGRARRLESGDRFTYGTVLSRLGRHREALAQFESVRDPGHLAEAQYQRARTLFRLDQPERALTVLRKVRDSVPGEDGTAATAGWLLADWYVDHEDDTRARLEFSALATRYPREPQGERAAFQAALLTWMAGENRAAATEFDTIADRQPAGAEATAAAYWSGRAWQDAGDTGRARQRWRSLIERSPQSYYVVPAARQLGDRPFPSGIASGQVDARADSLLRRPDSTPPPLTRAALLDSLGLDVEARFELDRYARDAQGDAAGNAGWALLTAGYPSRALQLAMRVVAQGGRNPALSPLLYPLVDREVLEREAAAAGLEPFLIAGLIRQESLFDPRARPRANARGLMQVLPSVGAQAARANGYPEWDEVLLYQPDVNVHIGLRHLAERWAKCGGSAVAALAAYNAGSTPVNRWLARPGTADAEIFIERIPYVETRDYVRRVLYNQARYEALYAR